MDAGRLAITVTHADGTITRWGHDDQDTGVIPNDLSFSNSTPGGFKDCSCSLFRDLEPRIDENLHDTLTVYGPGGQVAWQGRVAQLPRQTQGGRSVQPGAVGWSAHLTDKAGFMEVYVDRDPSQWQEPGLARRVQIAAGGDSHGAVTTSTDGGLSWGPTEGQALAAGEGSELVYSAPASVLLAKLAYKGTEAGTWTGFDGPGWFTCASPAFASSVSSGGLTFDGTIRTATLTARRYLMLRSFASIIVTPGAGMLRAITPVAVYGNHGLTLHTVAAGEPDGVYASDAIADILTRAAPLLDFTTGTDGTIQPTTYPIQHLAFTTPTTAADAIATVNAPHGFDWLVWEGQHGPTFHYLPAGTGTEWQARLADGANLSLEGDTASQIINGVIVAYTDNGTQKYAGPVGSGLDVEDAALEDADPDNPATAHGIDKWPTLPLSTPTTDAGAVELGALFLAEQNLASRKGQMTLTGTVRHPSEGLVPVWRVRAGDTVKLTDRPGDPARRVVEVSYSHASRTATLTLDSTANKVEALMERIALYTGALA